MKVARNALYNVAGFLLPLTVSLLSVPLYIHHLGEARYGVLVLVWLMTGFLFSLDLGIGMAIRFEIARRLNATDEERGDAFWTATILSLAFGAVSAVVMYYAARFAFGHVIDLDPALREETLATVPWIALSVPLGVIEGVMTGSLIGQEKFFAANLSKVIGATVAQFLPLLAVLLLEPTLGVAVPASMLGKLVLVLLLTIVAFRAIRAGIVPRFHRSLVHPLLGYGIWSSVGSFGRQVLAFSDRFIVGAIVGAAPVALYTVPMNLMNKAQGIPRSVVEAFFPRVANATGDALADIADRAIRTALALGLCLTVGAMVVITPFISWWVNPDFAARVGSVAPLSTITILASSTFAVITMILRAVGQPKVTTTTLLAEMAPFLVGLYYATVHFGLTGAALVVIARGFIDGALLSWRAGFAAMFFRILPQSLVLVAIAGAVVWFLPDLTPLSAIARLGAIVLACAWSFWISRDLRMFAGKLVSRVRARGRGAAA